MKTNTNMEISSAAKNCNETFNAVLKQSYQILNCCLSLLVDLICPYVWPFGLLSLAFRHSRVHGPRDVWGALWRVSGCVCLWHVYAGDGHIRISLLGVPECCPDLQKSHQRESCFPLLTPTPNLRSSTSPFMMCMLYIKHIHIDVHWSAMWSE